METDPLKQIVGDMDDMCMEKVLALNESLDPGLGFVRKCKVDLPVSTS